MSGGKHKHNRSTTENRMIKNIDELAAFEQFKSEILPYLRDALQKGASAEEIYKKAEALAAARAVTIAATETDASKALSAIKDILDRSGGKPTDKREITHKYKDLSDEELDAMLLSEAEEADDIEELQDEEGSTLQ